MVCPEFSADVLVALQVMFPPEGSLDKQGYDLQIGTNCVGPYLFHKRLQNILASTAATSPAASVRVLWAGSFGIDSLSYKPGGMRLDAEGQPMNTGVMGNYGQSKVGNLYLARHYAAKSPESGVLHACFNPGNLKTELQRHSSRLENLMVICKMFLAAPCSRYLHLPVLTYICRSRCCIPQSTAPTLSFGQLSLPSYL